ncbi:MAG: hypothetical protein HY841_09605 [Bacteroidetes bacterium]|nr:hypothetical protein [Bacteroidota bacterium]
MTLRFSSSDSYASNRDNLSLRSTVAPSLTAFIKTKYNKVAGQLLSRLFVLQAQTATQKIGRQILHSVRLAHLQPFFHRRIFLVGLQKSKPSAIKNTHQTIPYSSIILKIFLFLINSNNN